MSAGRPDVEAADLAEARARARAPRSRRRPRRASGTPSACRFWTASIIVSTLPASTPFGPAHDAVVHLHVEAAERVGAVALARRP